ncbi:hypothetical protein chiPu_0024560 [Chiloscyllium punctatum]|uniref:Uncharacterized protein n=1 Tax=Chiloscyllium punctatum TaxID=137246 RepID=A0A401TDN7_CHIPU|nr:hypothetical protein [Chiloscyllium punctatum]
MWAVISGTPGVVSPGTACELGVLEHGEQRVLVQHVRCDPKDTVSRNPWYSMWVVRPGKLGAASPGTPCGLSALEPHKQRALAQRVYCDPRIAGSSEPW